MSILFPICVFICEFFGIGFDLNSIFEVKKERRICRGGLFKKLWQESYERVKFMATHAIEDVATVGGKPFAISMQLNQHYVWVY